MSDTHGELVAALLMSIQALAGYPVPTEPPQVALVAHRQIEAMACRGPCPVLGWTPYRQSVVYLDNSLDPQNHLWARGILVHELVHFVQDRSARFAAYSPCVRVVLREREAVEVQTRWLRLHNVAPLPVMPTPGQLIRNGECTDDRAAIRGEAFAGRHPAHADNPDLPAPEALR